MSLTGFEPETPSKEMNEPTMMLLRLMLLRLLLEKG